MFWKSKKEKLAEQEMLERFGLGDTEEELNRTLSDWEKLELAGKTPKMPAQGFKWNQLGDAVVIGTGEYWTDETQNIYQFEYENQMIVKGMVGDKSFVCFTPAFIQYYYDPGDLPNSLIYMATCHATYDDSMANAFLESGAGVYLGWTQNTVFFTNSKTSVTAFRLFSLGLNVHHICGLIRYGGFYNFLFRSKLTYFGDGDYKLPKF